MFKLSFWLVGLCLLSFCPTIEAKSLILLESKAKFRDDQTWFITSSMLQHGLNLGYSFEFYTSSNEKEKTDSLKYPEKLALKLEFKSMNLNQNNKMTLEAALTWFDVRTNEVLKSELFLKEVVLESEKANSWRIVELISWKEENRHLESSELSDFLKELTKKIVRTFILLKSPDYLSAQGGN